MNPALVYWVVVASEGVMAAVGSWVLGATRRAQVLEKRPELRASSRAEGVRDGLLVIGLGFNLLVGIFALLPRTPANSMVTLVALLGGATCMAAFASFNFWIRAGR